MKLKNKALIWTTTLLTALTPGVVSAQTGGFLNDANTLLQDIENNKKNNTEQALDGVLTTLKTVLGFVRTAGIVIAVIMLVWCAVQLASSAGNQQKRAQAMEGIKNVLIATAIIGGAAVIAQLALGILG